MLTPTPHPADPRPGLRVTASAASSDQGPRGACCGPLVWHTGRSGHPPGDGRGAPTGCHPGTLPAALSTPLSRGLGAWAGTPLSGQWRVSQTPGRPEGVEAGPRTVTPCARGQGRRRPRARTGRPGGLWLSPRGARPGAGGMGRAAGRRGWFSWQPPRSPPRWLPRAAWSSTEQEPEAETSPGGQRGAAAPPAGRWMGPQGSLTPSPLCTPPQSPREGAVLGAGVRGEPRPPDALSRGCLGAQGRQKRREPRGRPG